MDAEPHWTLSATHLGHLTQAEFNVIVREIEDHMNVVLRRYNILPAHQLDYCFLEALCGEYNKARRAITHDGHMEEWRQS